MVSVPTVEISLGGETVTLTPTLEAMIAVNDALGGFVGAFQAIANGNLTAVSIIVAAGSGMSRKKAQEMVYGAGMDNVLAPVTEFTALLGNGGKRNTDDQEAGSPGEQ